MRSTALPSTPPSGDRVVLHEVRTDVRRAPSVSENYGQSMVGIEPHLTAEMATLELRAASVEKGSADFRVTSAPAGAND